MENLEEKVKTNSFSKFTFFLGKITSTYLLAGSLAFSIGGFGCESTDIIGINDIVKISEVEEVKDKNNSLCWDYIFDGEREDKAYSIQQTTDGGYIVAGTTELKYDSKFVTDVFISKLDLNGDLEWNKTFGGNDNDDAKSIQQTTDGGYVVAGCTRSKGAGADAWILKLDINGDLEWDKTFGGNAYDGANSIQQTTDGGYVMVGGHFLSGYSHPDGWLLKLDINGDLEWDKNFSGSGWDHLDSIQQTTDGGYIVAGKSGANAWILKLDLNGDLEWDETFGKYIAHDNAYSVQQTTDGGYVVAGKIKSHTKLDTSDTWIFKINQKGDLKWQNIFGGIYNDFANSIQQTDDGGYIVASTKDAFSTIGSGKIEILKLQEDGDFDWKKTFGNKNLGNAYSVQQTTDGGYIVAGSIESKNTGTDAWVLKLDQNGDLYCK